MDVVFLAPGYPAEMPEFTRALAECGARVLGVGDQPVSGLPPKARHALHDYLQVPRLLDEDDVMARVHAWLRGRNVDLVECQWEPLVLLAARMRERFGLPGMSHDTVLGFRDKQLMKERVGAAGLRVPKSVRVRTAAEARKGAEELGFPLILKPIAGAGSADTWRVEDAAGLDDVLRRMGHVTEASLEEFVDGEEYTFDTICVNGEPVYMNVAQYLPRPLLARQNEWISPVICTVRDLTEARLQDGITLGRGVLKALGMGTGFTHMEWYRKADGEVVFGEIGCRVGGAKLIDQMNYTSDVDLFVAWARAVLGQDPKVDVPRKYNTAVIFKRAKGQGRITRHVGVDAFLKANGQHVCAMDLLPPGVHRRDWMQTLVSDGYVMVRHPDWDSALELARQVAEDITLVAGG